MRAIPIDLLFCLKTNGKKFLESEEYHSMLTISTILQYQQLGLLFAWFKDNGFVKEEMLTEKLLS